MRRRRDELTTNRVGLYTVTEGHGGGEGYGFGDGFEGDGAGDGDCFEVSEGLYLDQGENG